MLATPPHEGGSQPLALLAAVLADSDDAIFVADPAGRISSWNPAAERVFGHRAGDVIGTPYERLVAPAHRGEVGEAWELVRREGRGARAEVDHVAAGDRTFPARVAWSPLHDDAGTVIGVASIVRDISEERLAQETLARSEAQLREGEALAHVGSWLWDLASSTVQWSAELHRIHGVEPQAFDGTLDAHLRRVHPDDRAAVRSMLDRVVADGPEELTYRIVRPDGAARMVFAKAEPIRDGTGAVIAARGIAQDVTERHTAEEAMRRAYEAERLAAVELRKAGEMKDQFLSVVSHELRTPLTAILGFSLLQDKVEGEERDDLDARIRRNAWEMLRMVERLLDFSRLQGGAVQVHPRALSVRSAVESCAESLDGVVDPGVLRIDVPDGLTVLADPDALGHVLSNLVSNAARYGPPDGPIELGAAADGDRHVVISVRDHGAGVPPELRERIFDRFFRSAPSSGAQRGAGIGLAIVSEYVELQGGSVRCAEAPGGGAVFEVRLPAAGPA